ncbi:MAG: hypothetical protein KF782_22460, partial [Labilithrix sp.]|nr:hypothetical protein [Labilithrix sp.]
MQPNLQVYGAPRKSAEKVAPRAPDPTSRVARGADGLEGAKFTICPMFLVFFAELRRRSVRAVARASAAPLGEGARSPRRTLFIARASLELALERASGGRPRVVHIVSWFARRAWCASRRAFGRPRTFGRAPRPRAFVRAPSSAQGGPSRPVVVAISPRPRARRRAPGR